MKLVSKMNDIIRFFCGSLLALMTVLVIFQVISRKFLSISVAQVEEIARYCMVWSALLGAAVGVFNKSHVAVDLLVSKAKEEYQKYIAIFTYIVMAVIFAILLYFGTNLSIQAMTQNSTSMPHLKMGFIMMVVPLTGIIGLVNLATLLIIEIKK